MVMPLRIAFVEWPEALSTDDEPWRKLRDSVTAARPDILITNELPFGPWLAEAAVFSEAAARLSLRAHEKGLEGLIDLSLPAVVSTRPVWNGKRLANEAFVLENGAVRCLHRKQYFPNEPGWFESEWYAGDASGFEVAGVLGLKVGVLVCTEAMFNERARAYGRQKASLIVIPRASGTEPGVMENSGRHGIAGFRCLRRQFEPDRTLEGRDAVWRRRFCLRAARTVAGGDDPGQSRQNAGPRSRRDCRRAEDLPMLCSRN